jgi:hypothetical protein
VYYFVLTINRCGSASTTGTRTPISFTQNSRDERKNEPLEETDEEGKRRVAAASSYSI